MKRGQNNRNSIIIDEDDRTFNRPDRDAEPDRTFNREPERVPYSKQALMSVDQREGYVRRFVNEYEGEVAKMIKAGWAVVTKPSVNKSDLEQNTLDSVVRIVVNKDINANCKTAVLMETPIEWYEEDMQNQMKELDQQEAEIDPKKYHQKGFDGTDFGYMKQSKKFYK